MTSRLPAHAIEGLSTSDLGDFDHSTPPTAGQTPTWNPTGGPDGTGAYEPTTITSATALVPLTTTIAGVPQLVWDENDNLVMTEVPL